MTRATIGMPALGGGGRRGIRHGARVVVVGRDDRQRGAAGGVGPAAVRAGWPRRRPSWPRDSCRWPQRGRRAAGRGPVSRSATAPASQYTSPASAAAVLAAIDRSDEYAPMTTETPDARSAAMTAGASSRLLEVAHVEHDGSSGNARRRAFTKSAAIWTPASSCPARPAALPWSGKTAPMRIGATWTEGPVFGGNVEPAGPCAAHPASVTARRPAPATPVSARNDSLTMHLRAVSGGRHDGDGGRLAGNSSRSGPSRRAGGTGTRLRRWRRGRR